MLTGRLRSMIWMLAVAALVAAGVMSPASAGCVHPKAEHFHVVSTADAGAVLVHEHPGVHQDHAAGLAAAGSHGTTRDGGGEQHQKICCQLHVSCCVTALVVPGDDSIRPSDVGAKINPRYEDVPAGLNAVPPLRPPRTAA
jgi:hypothetical protein